jgi:hypothetical protein
MTAGIRIYPRIGKNLEDASYQAAFDLISADTLALTASTSMYCIPAAGPVTYTNFNLPFSVLSGGGGKPCGWLAFAIGGIRYRIPVTADS